MRVSEALDLGSIPNAATKNPVSCLEMGFCLFQGMWEGPGRRLAGPGAGAAKHAMPGMACFATRLLVRDYLT